MSLKQICYTGYKGINVKSNELNRSYKSFRIVLEINLSLKKAVVIYKQNCAMELMQHISIITLKIK